MAKAVYAWKTHRMGGSKFGRPVNPVRGTGFCTGKRDNYLSQHGLGYDMVWNLSPLYHNQGHIFFLTEFLIQSNLRRI